MTQATQLTIGGAAIGLMLLGIALHHWWKGKRDPKDLIPSAEGVAAGVLATLCTGGLIGGAAGWIAGGANAAGGFAMGAAAGAEDGVIAGAEMPPLSPGGAVLVVVGIVVLCVAIKGAPKAQRRRILGGVIVGATLGLTAGAAAILGGTLVPIVNSIGDAGLGVIGYEGGA
ncbi:hypothetical protein [Streptomyces otsuchiensis]|uniref:hypothetical protein n=1 Tax=Streptomyces otsuchiensis TaxID=2681388 RepID=UPI001031F7DE|nr:hypothetical protein [Streptomyces otsuchiensis]